MAHQRGNTLAGIKKRKCTSRSVRGNKPYAERLFDPYLHANVKFASLPSVTLQFWVASLQISVLNIVEKRCEKKGTSAIAWSSPLPHKYCDIEDCCCELLGGTAHPESFN